MQDSSVFKVSPKSLNFEKITVDNELAARTLFEPGIPVWHIIRIRKIDDEAMSLTTILSNMTFVLDMSKADVAYSLYDYLEKQLKIEISFAQKEITVDFINDEDRQL